MDMLDRFSLHRSFAERAGLHDRLPFLLRQFVLLLARRLNQQFEQCHRRSDRDILPLFDQIE